MFKSKVLKNASWIIVAKLVQSVLGLVISMFTARYLGPSNYGLINYASSLVIFLAPIMQLGLVDILVQETVNNPEKEGKIYGTSIVLSLISSAFCILGILSFVRIVNTGETETLVVCALYSIILIFQSVELIQYWFQTKLLSKYTSVISLIAYVIISAYKIYLLATGKSIRWFAISNTLDFIIISFLELVIYKKLGGQHLAFSWKLGRSMLNKSKYYIASGLMRTCFQLQSKHQSLLNRMMR